MSDLRTLRFAERAYYDIESDLEVVDLLAITNMGSYRAIVPAMPASRFRANKEAFKKYVLNDMAVGNFPGEVYDEDLEEVIKDVTIG